VMMLSNFRALSETRDAYYREYRFAEVFAQASRAPLSLLGTIRSIDGVRDAEARVSAGVQLEVPGFEDPVTGLLVSLGDDSSTGLNRLFLREGRLPEPLRDDEAVVSETFALAHGLRPGAALIAIINGRLQRLNIVGIGLSPEFVYAIAPGELLPDFARFGVLWMNRTALAAAFDLDGAFNNVVLTLYPHAREPDVIDALDDLLAPFGGIGAHGRDLHTSHRFLAEELEQIKVMTAMFSAIFLTVSAFLLNVVIGRLISTQREQIAVLKAFGYGRWDVARHYAFLVSLLISVGLVPGLLLGAWMGRGLADIYMQFYGFPFLHFRVDADVIAMAVLFAASAGIIGTLGGLQRVLRLAPAEAMRPEVPPTFRRTLTERIGFGRLLSPAMRMVVRNLERTPLRSTMAVLGIGLAAGILVMSRFQAGAVNELISLQFNLAQRDDLTVIFSEPASARAAQELATLPGVARVEPYRMAAVVLRNGHRSYRGVLQGMPDDPQLRRALDRKRQAMAMPAEGVLLTDWLADMLAVVPGDTLLVEFLEGHRETTPLRVAGTVSEYLGVNAYARQTTVNRLLREHDAISGAWLALTPEADRAGLLRQLRAHPRIAGVTDRQAMMAAFRETMAQGILVFGLVATLMATSIAVGVVYNAARIALAERARELASLRVLGYTPGEVKRILGGELMLLTGAALAPGVGLGVLMSLTLVVGFRSELYRIPLMLFPAGFAFALLTIITSAVLATLWVQRRLDHLDLVAVLKTKE